MPHPRFSKFVIKAVVGIGFSAAIGVLIKCEIKVVDYIDEHFTRQKKEA